MDVKAKRPARPAVGLETADEPPVPEMVPSAVDLPAPPSAAALLRPAEAVKAGEEIGQFGGDALAAIGESQTALMRGLEAMSAEIAGLARSGIAAAARSATQMLAVKTLADAVEINTGLMRSSFDTVVGGSVRLSELGAKMAVETVQPLWLQIAKNRAGVGRRVG